MAIRKINSRSLVDDAIATADIADGSISTAKLADDAVTTAKVADTVNLGRRNLIINGRFQFWQRGTSITGNSGAAPFLADRFFVQDSSQFTSNISRDIDVPSGQGFIFSQKREWTTAHDLSNTGSYSLTEHKIERNDVNHLMSGTSDAKKVTLSFWVKSSVTGNHSFTMQIFASSRRSYKTTYNIAAADTWEKKTITIQMDTNSAGAFSNAGNSAGIFLRWGHGAGSQYANSNVDAFETTDTFFVTGSAAPASVTNATWYITGIQLEVGDTATPFEFLRESEELALCQRYYQVIADALSDLIGVTVKWSAGNHFIFVDLPTEMRTQPTLDTNVSTLSAALRLQSAGYSATGNNLQLDGDSSERRLRLNTTVDNASITNGYGGWIRSNNSSIYVNVDAEL